MAQARFFRIEQHSGRWCFITPDGAPFFSMGLNHLDPATLRNRDNVHLWQQYDDTFDWIRRRVAPDLRSWGFNTIGWTQEVVIRTPQMHRHSRSWTLEEYRASGMPFCHLLPFAEIHQWEVEMRYPDVFAPAFEEWCDYVARRDCAAMKDEPDLIGYFFSDCPAWVHPTTNPQQKGPWFDPQRLETESGRSEFARMVERYYEVTCGAIRRYDTNHLILGDRLEAARPLPKEVLQTAARHVDVLSFQFFGEVDPVAEGLATWHAEAGRPVLLADAAPPRRKQMSAAEQGAFYRDMMRRLFELRCVVGWHYCGAYIENHCRQAGLLDRFERPQEPLVQAMAEAHREIADRLAAGA